MDQPQVLLVRLPVFVILIIATLMEFVSVFTIFGLTKSICIDSHEISSAVAIYIMFNACPIIPNIVFMIGVFALPRLCKDPISIVYNIAMGIMCIVGSVILSTSLTTCGNEAMDTISVSALLGLIAGIFHILNGAYTHSVLPWDETYLLKRHR